MHLPKPLTAALSLIVTASLASSQRPYHRPGTKGFDPVEYRLQRQPDTKYFQEAGDSLVLGHYDARYFRGLVAYDAHRPVLRHLIRSYLTAFGELGIETWIAHGTLLGWWWNGRIMPWDYDLDVQVSARTMAFLAASMNGTTHQYVYTVGEHEDDPSEGILKGQTRTKKYLLDVNPHYADRPRQAGQNVIDARWIDTDNGMFVDITALAEHDPKQRPGIWSCKNFHYYEATELYPMRETEFEGVPALVPFAFENVIASEYGIKAFVTTEWEDHRWDPAAKEWVLIKHGLKDRSTAVEKLV